MPNLAEFAERRRLESLPRDQLAAIQLELLNRLLEEVVPRNAFYRDKFRSAPSRLQSLDELELLPATTKEQLVQADVATRSTYPPDQYVRYHQTSGTHGRAMPVLDTTEDWQWWIACWQYVLDAAEVTASDRAFLAFSFGPFIGFWSAHDAFASRGTMTIPGGGLSSHARLDLIERTGATIVCCTPSYALHLADVAVEHKIDLRHNAVSRLIVAGEPGGSSSPIRQRIEQAWNARVIDHAGATEVGPWGYADREARGLHIVESQFLAEFRSVETGRPAAAGELAQLVLTALGRRGMPCIRYRTGDLVRPRWNAAAGNNFALLEGGVLGRADDMLVVRGVNVFPSSVEAILRSFPEVVEYRMTACRRGEMDDLVVEVEDHLGDPQRIAEELNLRLGLKVDVTLAKPLSLPRFEGKGRRFVDLRASHSGE
jgi:phenylacetate-CoA ligase